MIIMTIMMIMTTTRIEETRKGKKPTVEWKTKLTREEDRVKERAHVRQNDV